MNMNSKAFIGIIIPVIFLSLSYGILVGAYEFFPYDQISQIKEITFDELSREVSMTNQVNLQSLEPVLIEINNSNDITQKQNSLIKYIWKNNFPTELPLKIENDFSDKQIGEFKNLDSLEKISIPMEYGIESIVYHLISEKPNNKLVIYHHGHSGDFRFETDTINYFLDKGYSVLAFNMPLKGMNNQPTIDTTDFGKIKFVSHRQFPLLESDDFSPLKYFIHPIILSLNYIDEFYNYASYDMVGLSGGGWTTIISSAIDNRISQSFSVAGSYPLYLRYESQNIGDYEQLHPDIYKIANYLELYVMGSSGDNRKLVQIFNKYDPCCFTGELSESYETLVKKKASELNGNFEIYIDASHKEHKISQNSLELIHDSLNKSE